MLSTMQLLGRCLMMKKKDTSFITTMLRGKDLVSGKTIVSGTLGTMRDIGHNERTLRHFVCSCQGFREEELKRENKKRKLRNITRFGCSAKLVIARNQNTGQ